VAPQSDREFPGFRPIRGASGILVSADGFIVTLRRLVVDPRTGEEGDMVGVEVGVDHYQAQVVGLEPTLDLAILKIERPEPFPFLRFGDSGNSRPGHWAIAFGNPDGSERALIPGFVAFQPTRECYQDDLGATYLQTSVIVGDGALGGPLVNLRGEVIGVNARRVSSAPGDSLAKFATAGYALPSNIANAVYQGMLIRENKESPWLGISVLQLDDALRKKLGDPKLTGIYIDNVFDPSPAAAAKIRVGDVLQGMGGDAITNVHDFQRLLYFHGAGAKVKLRLVREKKPQELLVTIARRPPQATTR
jgi:serine protease Do